MTEGFDIVSYLMGQAAGGAGGYTVMTQEAWSALSDAQKQTYGLVLIGNDETITGPYWFGTRLANIDHAIFDHENGDTQTKLTATAKTHGYDIVETLPDPGLMERTYEFVLTMKTGRGYGLHMISLGGTNQPGGTIYFDSTMFGWWAGGSDRFRIENLVHSIPDDQRYHAAVVVRKSNGSMTFQLFFDGVIIAEKTGITYTTEAVYNSKSFAILYNQSNENTDYYTGTFYKFALTNAALAPSKFVLSE